MLANWLYFLALGLVIPVLGRVISTVVNPDGSPDVSPASSVIGGDVEALDKICTFLGVGFLGALSDVVGRKPLMAYSALGFAATCYLQASAKDISVRRMPPIGCSCGRSPHVLWSACPQMLFIADLVDGVSSCMSSVCSAYVADASPPERRAVNLGIFQARAAHAASARPMPAPAADPRPRAHLPQGVSVAGAFILGIPISAVLTEKYGLRSPMYAAAAVGVLNFALIMLLTPESLPAEQRKGSAAGSNRALRLFEGSAPSGAPTA